MNVIGSQDGKCLGCVAMCMVDGPTDSPLRRALHVHRTGVFGRVYQSCESARTYTGDGSAMASRTGLSTQENAVCSTARASSQLVAC